LGPRGDRLGGRDGLVKLHDVKGGRVGGLPEKLVTKRGWEGSRKAKFDPPDRLKRATFHWKKRKTLIDLWRKLTSEGEEERRERGIHGLTPCRNASPGDRRNVFHISK